MDNVNGNNLVRTDAPNERITLGLDSGIDLTLRRIPTHRATLGWIKPEPPSHRIGPYIGSFLSGAALLTLVAIAIRLFIKTRQIQYTLRIYVLLILVMAALSYSIYETVVEQRDFALRALWFSEQSELFWRGNEFMENTASEHVVNAFYIGITEVTQEQYVAVTGPNPSYFRNPKMPVESLTLADAELFCAKLSSLTGKSIRLPSEFEWEAAVRFGNQNWTNHIALNKSELQYYAWFSASSGGPRRRSVN